MSKRNILSSCLLFILSLFTFILVIIFYSSNNVDENWIIELPIIYFIVIPLASFLVDLDVYGTEKKKRPLYIYIIILVIILLSISFIIYFSLRFGLLAVVFNVPIIYFALIITSILLVYFNENITKKWKRPSYIYFMLVSFIILFIISIIYCILHFMWFAPTQYDMPPAALLPIPDYVIFLAMYLPIIGVLLSPRMFSGKPKETWTVRIHYFMISLLVVSGIVYIGLASHIIPEKRLDTDLFFNFSLPVILSLLSLILSILIFNLKDRDEAYEKEDLIKS